jgi:CheY-like chemotaxis protein
MADAAILLRDDAQDSCTSLSGVVRDLDYPGSGDYNDWVAREQSRRLTSGLALLDYRSPGMDGVELDGRLKQLQPGTAGVPVTGFVAEAPVRAVIQANIRQRMPLPVALGRPISPIEEVAGGP